MKAITSFSEPASAITASAVPPALRTCSTVSFTPSAAVDRDQLGAFLGEQQRSRAPDAAAGAGDDDGFAFEAAHAFLPC